MVRHDVVAHKITTAKAQLKTTDEVFTRPLGEFLSDERDRLSRIDDRVVDVGGDHLNTKSYWEDRFSSGDWEAKNGRWQTEQFAKCLVRFLEIPRNFKGVMVDFGCGLGDALPVYRKAFPYADLIGVDIAESAIEQCEERFGAIASFIQGDHTHVPRADVIIASNVMEHLPDDVEVARRLLSRCRDLYVVVPYKEHPLHHEHVNTYDENYYSELANYHYVIFPCKGWSQYGLALWHQIYLNNLLKLYREEMRRRAMLIMFHFSAPNADEEAR